MGYQGISQKLSGETDRLVREGKLIQTIAENGHGVKLRRSYDIQKRLFSRIFRCLFFACPALPRQTRGDVNLMLAVPQRVL